MIAVCFDATGTLFCCPRLGDIYAEVLSRHGLDVEPDDILQTFPMVLKELDCRLQTGQDRFGSHPKGPRGYWNDVVSRLGSYLEVEITRFAAAELYDRFEKAESWRVYPEVPSVLEHLQQAGHRLAVISNWDERLPRVLANLGLTNRFDEIVFSQEVGAPKPIPRIFEEALGRLGIEAEAALHVGDSRLEDQEGADAAGRASPHPSSFVTPRGRTTARTFTASAPRCTTR